MPGLKELNSCIHEFLMPELLCMTLLIRKLLATDDFRWELYRGCGQSLEG